MLSSNPIKNTLPFVFREMREVVSLAYPILLSLGLSILSGLWDTIILGRYSTQALSVAVVGNSIFVVLVTAVSGLLRSIIPFYYDADSSYERGQIVFNLAVLALCLSLALCLAVPVVESLLTELGGSEKFSFATYQYLNILILGLIPLSLSMLVSNLFILAKNTRPLLKIGMLSFLVNAVMSTLLVFGIGTFKPMGAPGAALGSDLAYLFSFLVGLYLIRRAYAKNGSPLFIPKLNTGILKHSVKIGVPISAAVVTKFSAMSLFAIFLVGAGVNYVAAYGVLNSMATLLFIFPIAYGQAQLSRIKDQAALSDIFSAKRWFFTCLINIALIMLLIGVVIFLFKGPLIGLYTRHAVAQKAMPLMLLAVLCDGIQATSGILLTYFKATVFSFMAVFIGYFLVFLPLVYLTCHLGSASIVCEVYLALLVCLFCILLLQSTRLYSLVIRQATTNT